MIQIREPKLRFKADDGSEFLEWEEKRLGEVCEYGKRHGTGQNYVGTENMFSAFGGVIIENTESECNGILYSSGDILMSNIRPYLKKVWLADREGVCSTDVLVFRPIKIESEYLYCLIASDFFITKVMSAAKGSKMPRGDKKHIMEIPVFVPCCLEQRKIASFLSTIDEIIQSTESELTAWQERKKGVMQKIFNREVRFKADDGSEFPEWEEKRLSDIVSMHARIGWQGLRREEFLNEGEYYLITGTDFVDGKICFLRCNFIGKERYEQDVHIQIKNGDILITKDGTIGKVALVENLDKPATLNAGIFVLRFISNGVVEYLYQYLKGPYMLDYSQKHSTGGTIKHLNQGVLVNFPIPFPSLPEQRKIADCLSSLDDVINQIKAELSAWKEFKKGLLQQMFV